MRCLIAIPVYNESEHLPRVLDAVAGYGHDLLVIDDGSTDGTPRLLKRYANVAVITHPENRGYGQSIIDALHYGDCHGYDWVITMDCDEQHEPAQVPDFVAAAAADDADVISGSRYLIEHAEDDPPPTERRQINFLVNGLLDLTLGLKLTDSFCGFKAHRVAAMRRLTLTEPGYAFPLQFWPQVVRARLRVREIPVRRIYRDTSRSFGGTLDDPAARLHHYLEVLVRELRAPEPLSCSLPHRSRCACSTDA